MKRRVTISEEKGNNKRRWNVRWKERNIFLTCILFLHFRSIYKGYWQYTEQYMFEGVNLKEYVDAVF